jgi:hypothetical protein
MKARIVLLGIVAMIVLSNSLCAAPSADEILKEAKAKAASEGKAIFLVFDAPG